MEDNMNQQTMKLSQILQLLTKAAEKFVSKKEAEYFAQEYLEDYIRKYPRVDAFESALNELKSWKNNQGKTITTVVDKGASLLLDYQRLAPSLKLKWLHDEVEKRAKTYGIAMVGFYNSGGLDWLSMMTSGLSKRGIIAIFMYNGGPGCVIPYGGTKGFFGTNPMSYAIPTDGNPILTDMATSEYPFFEYTRAKKVQQKFSRVARVLENGTPTCEPENGTTDEEARLLPMGGGYKGYAMNLLVEILTGDLVRSISGGNKKSTEYKTYEYGGVLLGIDVSTFSPLSKFKSSMTDMVKELHEQKPGIGFQRVSVPGDRSFEKLKKSLGSGTIEVNRDCIKKLELFIMEV
jgi:LDH2 family malate/lactate/ureidoglycolate dehydrogenase